MVEDRICVYAHRISQVGQGVAYEEIGGLMRVRRGSTESADFNCYPHLADWWTTRRPTRLQYNAMGVL